jgi:hypothetical protein
MNKKILILVDKPIIAEDTALGLYMINLSFFQKSLMYNFWELCQMPDY